jgi:hypothetical protein
MRTTKMTDIAAKKILAYNYALENLNGCPTSPGPHEWGSSIGRKAWVHT